MSASEPPGTWIRGWVRADPKIISGFEPNVVRQAETA
jgi:hypothetical protein